MSFMSIKALEYNIGIRKPTLGKILRFVVLKLCGGIIVTEMKLLKPFPQKYIHVIIMKPYIKSLH